MSVHIERTELPGIGVRHDLVIDDGRRVSVVTFRDGGRQIAVADPDDPDRSAQTIDLGDEEATALAEVLGGSVILTQIAGLRDQVDGLSTEQIPVPATSPFAGRPLGDTRARTLTRCSIVAIVRESAVLPAPEPSDTLHAGDVLVSVGTREGLDLLVRIIGGR